MLAAYAAYLKEHHLAALSSEYLELLVRFDVPLLRLIQMSDEALRATARQGMEKFLTDLIEGRADDEAAESLRKWEADETPGVPKGSIQPSDLVLVYAAQKRAMLGYLTHYTSDVAQALGVTLELEDYFQGVQNAAFKVFARIREEAAASIARLAKELAREKAFIENITTHIPVAVGYTDAAGVVRWANPEFTRLGSQVTPHFLDAPLLDSFPTLRTQLAPVLERVLTTGVPFHASAMAIVGETSGQTTYWDLSYVPVLGDDARIEGLLIVFLDATARVEAERLQREKISHLQQVDRMKDEFLSILSHELRTPINALTGFGSILDDEAVGPLNAQQHNYVRKMLGGADTLLALVNDLLDMSRIQAGKFALNPEPMNFSSVVDDVIERMTTLAEQKRQTVVREGVTDLPPLVADPQRVGQVLTNLIGNAIKFSPEGSLIRVTTRVEDNHLLCEVSDPGEGIAPEDLPRLFQRFGQLNTSNTRKAGGTGLGLAISKSLIEAHGGEVGVRSRRGEGSTFWFTLPLEIEATVPADSFSRKLSPG